MDKQYRSSLQETLNKCEDEFELKVVYVAAGALGLSFAFISDIVDIANSRCTWALLSGWLFLVVCVWINCHSQLTAHRRARKSIEELDNGVPENEVRENIIRRNKNTRYINNLTMVFMSLGLLFIMGYVAINICDATISKNAML